MEQRSIPFGILAPSFKGNLAIFPENALPGAFIQQHFLQHIHPSAANDAKQRREGAKHGQRADLPLSDHCKDIFSGFLIRAKIKGKGEYIAHKADMISIHGIPKQLFPGR